MSCWSRLIFSLRVCFWVMVSIMTAPLHKVCMVPLVKPVQVLVGDPFPPAWHCITQLSVSKLAMAVLSPTVPQIWEAAYYLQASVLYKRPGLNLCMVQLCQLPLFLSPGRVFTGAEHNWCLPWQKYMCSCIKGCLWLNPQTNLIVSVLSLLVLGLLFWGIEMSLPLVSHGQERHQCHCLSNQSSRAQRNVVVITD